MESGMNRFERCECTDTLLKHDDNGVCRVKECDCTEFIPVTNRIPELIETVYRTERVA